MGQESGNGFSDVLGYIGVGEKRWDPAPSDRNPGAPLSAQQLSAAVGRAWDGVLLKA